MNVTIKSVALAMAMTVGATVGHAAVVPFSSVVNGDGSGNVCTGDFGTSPTCVLIIDLGGGQTFSTPQILKYDIDENEIEANTSTFPSLSALGTEFSYDGSAKTFTYTLGDADPLLTHFSVKKGNDYVVYNSTFVAGEGYFTYDQATFTYTGFFTEDEPSHIVLFDNASPVGVIPLPAPALLLLGGLGSLGALRTLRRKAA